MKKSLLLVIIFSFGILNSQTTPGEHSIKNLSINTEYSDFGTTFFGDNAVIFSSPRKRTMIKNIWKPNQQPYLDLYIGTIGSTGDIEYKEKFSPTINSRFHEAIVVFTKDRKAAYFTRNNIVGGDVQNDSTGVLKLQLFKASVDNKGTWTTVEKLPFNGDHFSTGHPALNSDETKLYFVSDRPESIGKTDIYYVNLNKDGTYGTPVNLGDQINTPEKEMFPFFAADGILYFSSAGHNSNGGLDVFAAKKYTSTYSKPLNLGAPINTPKDDFAYVLNKSNTAGFLSSNREGGLGDDDIYSFSIDKPVTIECEQTIEGIVNDIESSEAVANAKVTLLDAGQKELKSIITDENGSYAFKVLGGKNYSIKIEREHFKTNIHPIKTEYDRLDKPIAISFNLEKDIGQIIADLKIDPIYYDYDRWEVSKAAQSIVDILNKYPTISIVAQSYTDSRASNRYNMKLSEKRAIAIEKFLVDNGIAASRIESKWFGEENLVNNCANNSECTEEEHKLNRRTEFIVLKNN